jgi:hypothetical protein
VNPANNHALDDLFPATTIGRAFAAVRKELCRDEPNPGSACRRINTLRAAIGKQDRRWSRIVTQSCALLALAIAREKMDLGSPPELQRFLSNLEELLRHIARQEYEGIMPGQAI